MTVASESERSALLLSAILESANDAIITHGIDHTITTWNQRAEQIFGYAAEEVIGRSFLTLIPAERIEHELNVLERLKRGEQVGQFETVRQRNDGTIIDVSVTVSAVRDSVGSLIGFVRIVREISERKKAEKAALLWSAIVDSSDDAIVSKDLDGSITSWNRSAERMFGYTAAEIVGKSISVLIPPEQTEEEANIFARLRLGERVEHFETVRRRKDGSTFSASVTISPIKDATGKVIGASKIARDITQRKRMEQEVEAAHRDLQHFAYSVAHDLREPLRSQGAFAEILAIRYAGQLDKNGLELLGHIRAGVHRMDTLVKDLLSYAQAMQVAGPLTPVSAGEALAGALGNLAASIDEHRAQVTSDELPAVKMHRTQLQQLFQNLVSNGIKYCRTEVRPVIHVSAQQDSTYWVFSVKDNGIGIAAADRERVFGLFSRLHTREKYSGTGIGLALCQKIVERNGGRIWVESEPEAGSTFFFTVPS